MHFGNCRYFFVFQDGYVYCANLYHDYSPFLESGLVPVSDDIWPELQDVTYLGRVSSDDAQRIEKWIDQISYDNNKAWAVIDLSPEDIADLNLYIDVYGKGYPEEGTMIFANEKVTLPVYYEDPFSKEILQWLFESTYIRSWVKHMKSTGQKVWNSYEEKYRCVNENIIVQ